MRIAPSLRTYSLACSVVLVPDVSVVVPCYNGERFVSACLSSIQAQTLGSWEVVFVDDASTDSSADTAADIASADSRITVVRLPRNAGVSTARNQGARRCSGRYLLFLDVDDVLEPTMLQSTVEYLDGHRQVGVVYTGHAYIGPDGEDLGTESGEWPWTRYVPTRLGMRRLPACEPETPFASLFLVAAIIPSLALLRRETYVSTSGWDEELGQGCEDTDLFLQLALQGQIHHLPRPLVSYRRHAAQATQTGRFAEQYQKLHHKWANLALEPEQRTVVDAADWFRRRRFVPLRQASSTLQLLRSGKVLQALRVMWAAFSGYSPRKPPTSSTGAS